MDYSSFVSVDVEVLPNWWYAVGVDASGEIVFELERRGKNAVLSKGTPPEDVLTFNGNSYDLIILGHMLKGASTHVLARISEILIEHQPLHEHRRLAYKPKRHIDMFKTWLGARSGLKLRAARTHVPDLPVAPVDFTRAIKPSQVEETKHYCFLDAMSNWHLLRETESTVATFLQVDSPRRGVLSAPDIAELELADEGRSRRDRIGRRLRVSTIQLLMPPPDFCKDSRVVDAYNRCHAREPITGTPNFGCKAFDVPLKRVSFKIGVGGTHSNEKTLNLYDVWSVDVSSYYPSLLVALGMCPSGAPRLVERMSAMFAKRLAAKRKGEVLSAEYAKLVLNSASGKLNSEYSALYAPDIYLSMTQSGQLLLLALAIELERRGAIVQSANTDGLIVEKGSASSSSLGEACDAWSEHTGFDLDQEMFDRYVARDVSTYIALAGTKRKRKGALKLNDCNKNPTADIVTRTLGEALLWDDHYSAAWDRASREVYASLDTSRWSDFVIVRQVRGGAYFEGDRLGDIVRWYIGKEPSAPILTPRGSKVPDSASAIVLPHASDFKPEAVNADWYINQIAKQWSSIRQIGDLL